MKKLIVQQGTVVNPEEMKQRTAATRAAIIGGHITTFEQLFSNTTDYPLTTGEVAIAIGVEVSEVEKWRKHPYLLDMDAGAIFSEFLGMWPEVVIDLANNQYNLEKDRLKEKYIGLYRQEVKALQRVQVDG